MIRLSVSKWGNSAAVRLPATVLQQFNLDFNDSLDLEIKDGALVITPVKTPKYQYTLEELLKGMNRENFHDHIDFGPPVGKELF